jgi:hypothetical protein
MPAKPAAEATPLDPKMGLVNKLVAIMGELGSVPKEGFNSAQKYRFVRESDVVEKLVPLLARYHVYLHTTVSEYRHEALYQTQSGMTMWCDTVFMVGTWIDGDSGEVLPAATFVGTGADTGDKAVFKAQTGAEKYLLLKSLLISTGDDPEGDEKVDKATAATSASAGPRVVRREPTEGQQKGGHSTVPTAPQIAELRRLAKDRDMGVAALTRFIEATLQGGKITGVTTAADLLNFIQRLTGQQVGTLISALTEPDVPDDNDPPLGGPPAPGDMAQLFDDEPQDGVL